MWTQSYFFNDTAQSRFEVFQKKSDAYLPKLGIIGKFMKIAAHLLNCYYSQIPYNSEPFLQFKELKCDIQYGVLCSMEFVYPFQTT